MSPFWSPDSRFIGFFASGQGELKKIEAAGGPPLKICAAQVDGAPTWGGNTILFTDMRGGIYRVPSEGGEPTQVTQKTERELNHHWPEFLPDGRHFLYMASARAAEGGRATPTVYVGSLDGTSPKFLPVDSRQDGLRRSGLSAVRAGRRTAGT